MSADSNGQIRDGLTNLNIGQNDEEQQMSYLPDRLSMFTAREDEIQKVISFLKDERRAIVSLHGGPGFGKTAIAVEVSHKLRDDHNIPVVFSQLNTATTIDEMILRLCRDVCVNYEDDPKSSLMFWLKTSKNAVIFVMDDIDNLLEDRTPLYELIRLIRKDSNQHCQILTTSRMSYTIPELSNAKVQVGEMNNESCTALLRKICPKQDEQYLQRLAELCGQIPLAMRIAGSQVDDFEDSDELLQYLDKQPIETLECPESDQSVYRTINTSYERLDHKQKRTLVRLAVFEGNFSEHAARAVVAEKDNLHTKRILKNLAQRSLIKQLPQHRFSLHLLIRRFLIDELKTEEERKEKPGAELLMVGYYLNLGHNLTIQSYSKNGYKENREAMKQEAHNIQNVLKICCQQDTISDISNCVAQSEIYTTSARFFSLFVRTIIHGSIVDKFLQWCGNLAGEREQHGIKINFDCVLAAEGRSKSNDESDEYFKKIERIKEEFEKHYKDLTEDKSLCALFYCQYGQELVCKSKLDHGTEREKVLAKAHEELKKSFELRKTLTGTCVGKADKIFSLIQLGNVLKDIAACDHCREDLNKCEKLSKQAKTYYEEAIQQSETDLGEHELTSACYKRLGDLFFTKKNSKMAEEKYAIAKEMRENLGLDASEKHVFLLNNLGKCLGFTNRKEEAINLLEKARDMAEKLAESDEPNVCKAKVYTTLAIVHNSAQRYSNDALRYANKALELEQIENNIKKYEFKALQKILGITFNDVETFK